MSTFYRVHWTTCPPFTAANAWSSLMGIDRKPNDPSLSECQLCGSTGEDYDDCPRCKGEYPVVEDCERCDGNGQISECRRCDGTGWEACIRGYSCFDSPAQLIRYFSEPARSGMVPNDEPVVVFEGWQADTGFDDEPTAVPEHVIETLPWAEFVARHQDQEAKREHRDRPRMRSQLGCQPRPRSPDPRPAPPGRPGPYHRGNALRPGEGRRRTGCDARPGEAHRPPGTALTLPHPRHAPCTEPGRAASWAVQAWRAEGARHELHTVRGQHDPRTGRDVPLLELPRRRGPAHN